jgi:uncharacterized membrane-anchored protein
MKNWQKIVFIAAVVFQIGALSYMVITREYLLRHGHEIRLKCKPVDPRSLFSGDYVRLSYEISSFTEKDFEKMNFNNEVFNPRDRVYVELKEDPDTKIGSAARISHTRNLLGKDSSCIIRGTFENPYNFRITYGVEEYFVPQFEGRKIEQNLADTVVVVALSSDGESAIKSLYLNNRTVEFY